MFDKNVPGPGKYYCPKPFGSESIKYSLYGRRGDGNTSTSASKNAMPGPGYYKVTNGPDQKFPVSTMKNIVNIKWASSKAGRFIPLSIYGLI
jgi:hypothetical protein